MPDPLRFALHSKMKKYCGPRRMVIDKNSNLLHLCPHVQHRGKFALVKMAEECSTRLGLPKRLTKVDFKGKKITICC